MRLRDLSSDRKTALARRWLNETLDTYPADTSNFLKREKDRFANPVGQTLADGTRVIVDQLLAEQTDHDEVRSALASMLRIRSVQDFAPSEAVSFVFLLKAAVREELGTEAREKARLAELAEFDRKIDELALLAFDLYAESRQKIYEIRVSDVKRQVSGLMRRLNLDVDAPRQGPDVRASDLRRPPSKKSAER